MSSFRLHKSQVAILYALRHSRATRFGDLMRQTGLESDTFKFHLKQLIGLGSVHKAVSGAYALTPSGKEFANALDERRQAVQKGPKLSVLLTVPAPDGSGRYLFQRRARNPYFGFWSCIGGPVLWGEEFEMAAQRELEKQTGLTARFSVESFYRKKDYSAGLPGPAALLEDKLFVILRAEQVRGELTDTWHGGHNQWMTADDYERQAKRFDLTLEIIGQRKSSLTYASRIAEYTVDEY